MVPHGSCPLQVPRQRREKGFHSPIAPETPTMHRPLQGTRSSRKFHRLTWPHRAAWHGGELYTQHSGTTTSKLCRNSWPTPSQLAAMRSLPSTQAHSAKGPQNPHTRRSSSCPSHPLHQGSVASLALGCPLWNSPGPVITPGFRT